MLLIFRQVNPYGTPDPTAEFPQEIYKIDRKSAENRDVVQFELASVFDLAGIRAPKDNALEPSFLLLVRLQHELERSCT